MTCSESGQNVISVTRGLSLPGVLPPEANPVTSMAQGNQAFVSHRLKRRMAVLCHAPPFSTKQSMLCFVFSFDSEDVWGVLFHSCFMSTVLFKALVIMLPVHKRVWWEEDTCCLSSGDQPCVS